MEDEGFFSVAHHERLPSTTIGAEETVFHSQITHELDSLTRTGETLESDPRELIDGHKGGAVGLPNSNRFEPSGARSFANRELVLVLNAEVGLKIGVRVVDLWDFADGFGGRLSVYGKVCLPTLGADVSREIFEVWPNITHRSWLMICCMNHGHPRIACSRAIIRFGDENGTIGCGLFASYERSAG
jgi:hypothetical protein